MRATILPSFTVLSIWKEALVPGSSQLQSVDLAAVSRTMVVLHKEQFGRGPLRAQSHFAGRDTLVCILEEAMLPAERRLVELGDNTRVRETRVAFHIANEAEFVNAIEQLVRRKVRACSSAIDPVAGIVYEIFTFEADSAKEDPASSQGPDSTGV
jgi:uncharacterized protein YbcI